VVLQADNDVQCEEWVQTIKQSIESRRYKKRFGKVARNDSLTHSLIRTPINLADSVCVNSL